MRLLLVCAGLVLAVNLRASLLEDAVRAFFAPKEVQIVFAIPASTEAEIMNETSRLVTAEGRCTTF